MGTSIPTYGQFVRSTGDNLDLLQVSEVGEGGSPFLSLGLIAISLSSQSVLRILPHGQRMGLCTGPSCVSFLRACKLLSASCLRGPWPGGSHVFLSRVLFPGPTISKPQY